MFSLSRLVLRFVLAGVGFSLAVLVSLVIGALALGTVESGSRMIEGDGNAVFVFAAGVLRGGLVLPLLASIVWPAWGAAIVLSEAVGARSLLVHLAVATGIAVVGVAGGAPLVGPAHLQAAAAIGLTAGFAHWLVAGRTAGVFVASRAGGDPRSTHDADPGSALSGKDPSA